MITMRCMLVTAVLAIVFLTGGVGAQDTGKVWRVGVMVNGSPEVPLTQSAMRPLREGFAKLGYIEGRNLVFEWRYAHGHFERHPQLAAELVALKVDMILALGGPASAAAEKATDKIPIVFSIVTDPVALGLARTMERPGGNATGVTSLDGRQGKAQFELIREALPEVRRVTILSDAAILGADETGFAPIERDNIAAAKAVGIEPRVVKLKGPAPDLESIFREMAQPNTDAVLVLEVPVALFHQQRIAQLAALNLLPTVFPAGTTASGLFAYGTTVADTWPIMPALADKIFKGANPAEIPIEVVTRRELVVNAKLAKQLGVGIPASVLKRADKVIE